MESWAEERRFCVYRCQSHVHLISCHVRCCGSHLKMAEMRRQEKWSLRGHLPLGSERNSEKNAHGPGYSRLEAVSRIFWTCLYKEEMLSKNVTYLLTYLLTVYLLIYRTLLITRTLFWAIFVVLIQRTLQYFNITFVLNIRTIPWKVELPFIDGK